MASELDDLIIKNKQVWKDTVRYSDQFPIKQAQKIKYADLEEVQPDQLEKPSIVKIYHADVLEVTQMAAESKFNSILMVNVCSDNNPMPAIKDGALGLEYEVIRRTNLHTSLDEKFFPLRETDSLYSEKIALIKNTENKKLPKSAAISILSLPTIRRPSLMTMKKGAVMEESYEQPREEEMMKRRIEMIFKIATKYNHHTVIVSDFGCHEGNPQHKVVEFFNAAMAKYPIKYVFFAICEPEKYNSPEYRKKKKVKTNKVYEYFNDHIVRN